MRIPAASRRRSSLRALVALLAAGLLAGATSARTHDEPLGSRIELAWFLDGTVRSVLAIGDHDEDGVSDLALVLQGPFDAYRSHAPRSSTVVRILSGRDGAFLAEFLPDRRDELFRTRLAVLPRPDRLAGLAIGRPTHDGGGVELHQVDGGYLRIDAVRGTRFGRKVCDVADVDGDGLDDLTIMTDTSYEVASSRTGRIERSWERWNPPMSREILARAGARDGTGFQAVVVCSWWSDPPLRAHVVELLPLRGGQREGGFLLDAWERHPLDVASPGDVDGDGVWDVAVSFYGALRDDGSKAPSGLELRSGADGSLLAALPAAYGEPTSRLVETLDVDADGVLDLLCMVHVEPRDVFGNGTRETAMLLLSGQSLAPIARIPMGASERGPPFAPVYAGDAGSSCLLGVVAPAAGRASVLVLHPFDG